MADEDISKVVEKMEAAIQRGGGEIVHVENMGRKKLAYEVKKEKKGFYVLMQFKGKGSLVAELQRTCRLDESIIKFMTVKIKPAELHALRGVDSAKENDKSNHSEERGNG